MKKVHTATDKLVEELSHFLADSYVLYLKTQNFHWNVEGPNFAALHLLFEKQYQELALAVDEIAERIRALGAKAPASFSQFTDLSSLKEETRSLTAAQMLKSLADDHAVLSKHALDIIAHAQAAHDEATADLLIKRTGEHDKAAWMLRSSI